ncbi:MAG: hypothetical protein AB1635_04110 [Acidobacteriota bacterium]
MSCTSRFLRFQWEHHPWRRRVTNSEILTSQETNMWARVVYRDYVRCDTQQICEACGQARPVVSCMCDMERGERCPPRLAWLAETGQTA